MTHVSNGSSSSSRLSKPVREVTPPARSTAATRVERANGSIAADYREREHGNARRKTEHIGAEGLLNSTSQNFSLQKGSTLRAPKEEDDLSRIESTLV